VEPEPELISAQFASNAKLTLLLGRGIGVFVFQSKDRVRFGGRNRKKLISGKC
jgi:hypothetical protein